MTAENSMPLGDLIWSMEESMLLSDQAFEEGNDPMQHIVEEPHDKEGPPDSRITRQAFAAPSQDQQ